MIIGCFLFRIICALFLVWNMVQDQVLRLVYILQCEGVSLRRQLEHIVQARRESDGLYLEDEIPSRRSVYQYDPREVSKIIALPSLPSHLPRAEDLVLGHTLNRPTLGMLKSSLKFPHKDLEDGSGVYGSYDTLGETYGRHERILYTGFRRSPSDYIMVVPDKHSNGKPSFKVLPVVLDVERKERAKSKIREILKRLKPLLKGKVKLIFKAMDLDNLNYETSEPRKTNNNKRLFHTFFKVLPVVLDVERKERAKSKIREILKRLKPLLKGKVKLIFKAMDLDNLNYETSEPRKTNNNKRLFHTFNKKKLILPDSEHKLPEFVSREKMSVLSNVNTEPTEDTEHGFTEGEDDESKRAVEDDKEVDEEVKEEHEEEPEEEHEDKVPSKLANLWKNKDVFNYVKMSENAIDINELIPTQSPKLNELRQWWYFNQEDFQPFKD